MKMIKFNNQIYHSKENLAKHAKPDVARFHADIIDNARPCLTCHVEHRGVLAPITTGFLGNPHGEFIFRVTRATSCSDCHVAGSGKGKSKIKLLSNSLVSHIIEEIR